MKHVDNGPPYPPEIVFVGVGAIYRLNQSWPHSETIHVLDRVVGNMEYEGKHRAIRQHAFVPHWRGEEFGCDRAEDGEPDVRCGYYRKNHPTMAVLQ